MNHASPPRLKPKGQDFGRRVLAIASGPFSCPGAGRPFRSRFHSAVTGPGHRPHEGAVHVEDLEAVVVLAAQTMISLSSPKARWGRVVSTPWSAPGTPQLLRGRTPAEKRCTCELP
jgi:hypothetical protein